MSAGLFTEKMESRGPKCPKNKLQDANDINMIVIVKFSSNRSSSHNNNNDDDINTNMINDNDNNNTNKTMYESH